MIFVSNEDFLCVLNLQNLLGNHCGCFTLLFSYLAKIRVVDQHVLLDSRDHGVIEMKDREHLTKVHALARCHLHQFSSVQSLSHVRLFMTPWTAACQASLSITNSWSLHKLMSIQSVMPFNHLILCRPRFLLPSIFPSSGVF